MVKAENIKSSHLDADESIFFARELETLSAVMHEVDYPELKADLLIPRNTESDPADTTHTYRMFDKLGVAKIISDNAMDLPRVDVTGKEFTAQIRSLGCSFGYTLQELRAARKTGRPLDQMRANASREAAARLANTLAFFGDSNFNLVGFFNNVNVPSEVILADGTGASKLWSTKTADQILRDMNQITSAPILTTKGISMPNMLLVPLSAWNVIRTKKVGVDSNMTVLRFFLETNPGVQVEWVNDLATAGSGSTTRAMAYRRDPMNVYRIVPVEYEVFPPQERGLEFLVPAHARVGSVVFIKPLSAVYADGI